MYVCGYIYLSMNCDFLVLQVILLVGTKQVSVNQFVNLLAQHCSTHQHDKLTTTTYHCAWMAIKNGFWERNYVPTIHTYVCTHTIHTTPYIRGEKGGLPTSQLVTTPGPTRRSPPHHPYRHDRTRRIHDNSLMQIKATSTTTAWYAQHTRETD